MKNNKILFKNILCIISAFCLLILANVGVFCIVKNKKQVLASNSGSVNIPIGNQNFNSNTSSTQPFQPSDFVSNVEPENSNLKAGVINLEKGEYSNTFTNANSKFADDNYVLMINSTTSFNSNFGYTTKNFINLSKNRNYRITVDVYTNNNGFASLYLFNEDNSIFSSINKISSNNKWSTYTFLISTNELADLKLKLGLYSKESGVVLFDNISAFEIDEEILENNLSSLATKNLGKEIKDYIFIDKKDVATQTLDISTLSFTKTEFDPSINLAHANNTSIVSSIEDSTVSDGISNKALKITNNENTYTKFTIEHNFNFEQNSIYKITVNAKTKNLSGKANLQLIEQTSNLNKNNSKVLSISASSTNDLKNGYTAYSFYINSYVDKSATFKLVAGVGDKLDAGSTGSLYVSTIRIYKVDYSTFEKITAGNNQEKLDLATKSIISNNSIMLDNGNFNGMKLEDVNNQYPATPFDYTVQTGKNTQYYGIVNTNATEFNKLNSLNMSNLINPTDPGKTAVADNNNVLMMYNNSADVLSYTSKSKTLEAKKYYKFSVQVQTQSKFNNQKVNLSLITTQNEKEICLSSIDVLTPAQVWKNVDLYLYTANQSLDVSLKITLNSTDYAYAYIDNAMFNFPTPNQSEFNQEFDENYVVKTDLSNLITSNSNENFSKLNFFNYEKNDNVQVGNINLNAQTISNNVVDENSNLALFKSLNSSNKNVIGIRAFNDVDYNVVSSLGYKLKANSFYKISVDVYTQNLHLFNPNSDTQNIGASLKLSNFDDEFVSIVSNQQWSTYSFYIKPNEDTTTYLELGLGSDDCATSGDVFFGNIVFEDSITEEIYNQASNTDIVKVLSSVSKTATEDTNKTEESDKKESTFKPEYILYYISSILFGVSIIIAIVGVAVRKIKWKKPVKKSKNSYDRNQTVSKQYYMRKATTLRQTKTKDIEEEINVLSQERSKFEESYKQDLAKLRQLKIKRAPITEITKLEKEMKKNQKLSAQIGVKVNRLTNELEYVQTDAYINILTKQLAQNPTSEDTKSENKN